MLKITDKEFEEIIILLDSWNSATRKAYFSENNANVFLVWWYYYFSDDFITNLADFHYEWIEALFSDKDILLEGFRGSIKTSIVSAVVSFKVTNKFCNFVVWQSYEDGASTRNTTQIAIKLLSNRLMRDYGKLFSLTGSKEDLQKKSVWDFDTTHGVKVLATSLGQKLRGAISRNQRPDLLILDDIDVTDSVKNPDIIQKNYDKITGETFGAMTKEGKAQIYFLWNTINEDGVVRRFANDKKHDKNWRVFWQPLIVDEVIQWKFFTEDTIERIRSKEGERAFNQNYLLIPIDRYGEGIVKTEDLRYFEHASLDDFDALYMHADTTHTGKTTSDYFSLGVLGESKKDKNFYMLDFVLKKCDVETQARASIVMYQKFQSRVKKFTYDEKANQWFWFWIKKLAKEEYGISLPIEELKYPNDKITHFEPHVPHFKANRVYLPSNNPMITTATDQLLAFPTKWVNDDFVDLCSWLLDNFQKPDFITLFW